MAAMEVKFSVDARDKMLRGIDILANAVRVTLRLKGRSSPHFIVAKRIASGFSRLLVEPAAREYASSRFNPHHGCTSPGVLDRRLTLEAGLAPMNAVGR